MTFSPRRIKQALAIAAEKLEVSQEAVRNLAIDLWEDGQLDLICELFETFERVENRTDSITDLPLYEERPAKPR